VAVGIQSALPMGVSERRAIVHGLANGISLRSCASSQDLRKQTMACED
jgi:hypothetical protein